MMFSGCFNTDSELLYSEKFSGKYIAFLSSSELAVCAENPAQKKEYSVLNLLTKKYSPIGKDQKSDFERKFIHLFFDEKYKLRAPYNADFIGLYNNDSDHYIPPEGPLLRYPRTFQDSGIHAWNFQKCEKIYRKGTFFPHLLVYTPIKNSVFVVRDIESGTIVKTDNYPYGSYHRVFMNECFDALVVKVIEGRFVFSPLEFYTRNSKMAWSKKRRLLGRGSVNLSCSEVPIRFLASGICAFVPSTIGRSTLVASKFGDRVELILYDFENDKFSSIPVTGIAEIFARNYTDVAYVAVSPCRNYVAYVARPRSSTRELRVYKIEWLGDLPKSSLLYNQNPVP